MTNIYKETIKETIANCILKDITTCLKNDSPTGAVLLTYCAMDAMAFLSMTSGKDYVEKKDFLTWVKKYMIAEPGQSYQYDPIDFYGARCGLAHNYGAESALSKAGKCKVLIYSLGGSNHIFKPEKNSNLVIIGVERFIMDFISAVDRFLLDIENDLDLQRRVESRLPKLFRIKQVSEIEPS